MRNVKSCLMRRLIAIILLVALTIVPLLSASVTAFAAPGDGSGTETSEAEGLDQSLYAQSTALAAFMSNVLGPNRTGKHEDLGLKELADSGITPGDAGSIVGYGDPDRDFHEGFLANATHQMTTTSYDNWIPDDPSEDGTWKAYEYLRYGRLLNYLGLDTVGNSDAKDGGRTAFGLGMQVAYATGDFAPNIFSYMVDLLKKLNVFRLLVPKNPVTYDDIANGGTDTYSESEPSLHKGDTYSAENPEGLGSTGSKKNYSEEMDGTTESPDTSAGETLAEWVSKIYAMFQSFGLAVIIPMMLVFMIVGVLMSQRPASGGLAKKIGIWCARIAFIIGGVPMFGLMYTASLNLVGTEIVQSSAATRIVAGSFCDFESWVEDARLGVYEKTTLESLGSSNSEVPNTGAEGTASNESMRLVRRSSYYINKYSNSIHNLGNYNVGANDVDVSGTEWNTTTGKLSDSTATGTGDEAKKTRSDITDMLSRYSNSSYYEASGFDSATMQFIHANYESKLGSALSTDSAGSNAGTFYEMFSDTDEAQDWIGREIDDNKAIFKGSTAPSADQYSWSKEDWNIFANGNLTSNASSPGTNTAMTFTNTNGKYGTSTARAGVDPGCSQAGLSTVAMYNYLLTAFSDQQVEIFSTVRSTSSFARTSHYAVSLVGSGALHYAIGFNCLVVCFAVTVLAVVFGIGTLVANLKRSVSLLLAIPGAMLGILKSIIQVIVYIFMMIIELLVMMFLFDFLSNAMFVIAAILENAMQDIAINSTTVGGFVSTFGFDVSPDVLMTNPAVYTMSFIMVTVFAIFLNGLLFRYRRQLLVFYEYAWCRIWRLASFSEMKEVMDVWMCNRHSLYSFDFAYDFVTVLTDVIRTPVKGGVAYA